MQFTVRFFLVTISQLSQFIIATTLPTAIANHTHNNNSLNPAPPTISTPPTATIATTRSTTTSTAALKQYQVYQRLGKRNLDTSAAVTTESIKFVVNGEEVLSTYTYTLTTPVTKLVN